MTENIKINEEDNRIYLSEEILSKIKKIIKGYNILTKEEYDDLSTYGIDYNKFRIIVNEIEKNTNAITYITLKKTKAPTNLDKKLHRQLKDLCIQYKELNPNKNNSNLLNILKKRNDMHSLEELINLAAMINEVQEKMYLIRDLIEAKDDYIIDMKYFMKEEDINKFNQDYIKAINEKNIDKMLNLLYKIQKLILNEWNNYIGNSENMTDENFCFIGHSTNHSNFEGKFYSRYVSCSLYNQDVNETFNKGFGFIMNPNNIVKSDSKDMYTDNYSYDEEYLLKYKSIPKIHHPQRLIDDCKKQKQNNIKDGKQEKVYNEVVIDGFEPTGIFCFTNGAKEYDKNYKQALELKKHFPNLSIEYFDIMKLKKGEDLKEVELELINTFISKNTRLNPIEMKDLSRYELFLQKFSDLKQLASYNEDDIDKLFNYNLKLLSPFDTEPKYLFNGRFNDEEIKYILGKNIKYNIDYILNGDITIHSLKNLESLYEYRKLLNKYYNGLSELLDIITKVDLSEEIIETIKKDIPTNFYKISKCILESSSNSLDTNHINWKGLSR